MKIIVDKLPETCELCLFSKFREYQSPDGDYAVPICFLLDLNLSKRKIKRLRNCPLVEKTKTN